MNKILLGLVLVFGFSAAALAHSYKQGDVRIGHVWTRETPGDVTTADFYMPLLNVGTVADRLTGASSPVAERIEIHETIRKNGIASMKRLDFLALEPGAPVALSPGGVHLMVFGLKHPLKAGETVPLTLQFAKGGTAQVDVMVEAAGGAGEHHE